MKKKNRYVAPLLALLLGFVGALTPAVAAAQDDETGGTRIHIERRGSDDGEERVVSRSRVVFVGDDGEAHEIEGEGEGFAWIDGEHGRHVRMHMRGFGAHGGGFLGVSTTAMTKDLRSHFGAPEDAGVMVSQVVEDSAAFSAGLLVGDIITAVEGERISSPGSLMHAIGSHEEGDTVTLEVYRDGRVQDLSATLGKREGRGFAFDEGMFHRFPRAMKIDCEEEGGDCDIFLPRHLGVCGDDENCNVDISCEGGECSCSVNGEETDCEELHGIRVHPDD